MMEARGAQQKRRRPPLSVFRVCVLASNEFLIVQPGHGVTAGVERHWELTIAAKSTGAKRARDEQRNRAPGEREKT